MNEAQAASDPTTPADQLYILAELPELAPCVAANPAAPAALLRTLASQHAQAVRSAVAANPNTPLDLLLSLAGSYPAAFCANPVLPLLMLEQPNLPATMPPETLRRLLQYADVPAAILRWIVAHAQPAEAAAARLHIGLAGEAGAEWPELARQACWQIAPPGYDDLLLELIALQAIPHWLIEMLLVVPDRAVRVALARSPQTPRAVVRQLRRAGASGDLQSFVPVQHSVDTAYLHWLAQGGVYARRVAARNPATPQALLTRLAGDPDHSVRQGLAINQSTPPALYARLASDRSVAVRQLVARHTTSPPTLDRLSRDRATDVRWTVARNPACPLPVLERLAGDGKHTVRQAASRNPQLPAAVLQQLANDQNPRVQAMAARQLHTRGLLNAVPASATTTRLPAQIPASTSLEQIAADSHTPLEQLQQLAEHPNPRIRRAVASNPAIPEALIRWLADDDSPVVHQGVAQNPNLPDDLLERLAANPTWANYRVRIAIAHHARVSQQTLALLASDSGVAVRRLVLANPRTPAEARAQLLARSLEACLVSTEPFYHALALANPHVPIAAFEQAAQSSHWLVRFAAAQNPVAPAALLETLAQDGNRLVRAAAQTNLARTSEQPSEQPTSAGIVGLKRYAVGLGETTPLQRLAEFDTDPVLQPARAAMQPDRAESQNDRSE